MFKGLRFLAFFFLTATAFANANDPSDPANYESLKDWLDAQSKIGIKNKGGRLNIAGEVRAELQSKNEVKNGVRQRGSNRALYPASTRTYDIEVNLMLDYRADRTWASVKIEFDNDAGISPSAEGSGTFNRIGIERAFFGMRVLDKDTYTFDIVIGRRPLTYTFDSRLEFGSFMDGILFKYDQAFDRLGDFYFHGGPFLVNERSDHFAYVGELGLLNIWNSGLFSKYSLIDWNTKSFDEDFVFVDTPNDPNNTQKSKDFEFKYLVSQFLLGYQFVPKILRGNTTILYSAFLVNHAAEGVAQTNGRRENWAWYTGFSVGTARKKGDWSFDANYQWVQAQSIPGFDVIGVGRGNAGRVGFYRQRVGNTLFATTSETAVGSTNYRGFAMQLLYLWTNNLTMFQSWNQSITLDKDIGPFMRYKAYEIELIYAF